MTPSALIIFKLVDAALTAYQVSGNATPIRQRTLEMLEAGATAEEVANELVKLRDDAIAKAQRAADEAPG